MIFFGTEEPLKIYIRPGYTDLRKSINGLTVIIQQEMELDPFSGYLFLFSNRRRNLLKVVYWDRNGFCLFMKRLEKDKFPWLINDEEKIKITNQELEWLLKGIDFFKEHQSINFSKVI